MARSTPSPVGTDPIIIEARERWQRCEEAEQEQRKRILAAKQFRAGDQWDPDIRAAREGKNALQGVGAQPPRPCLTIDRISQPIRTVSNQVKTANFAIDVSPDGHGADDDTAQIFKGSLRRIQNQARDESPIEWAADGALEGIGWFRLRTEYVDNDPDPDAGIEAFDQEPRLERISNSLCVYCDPGARMPTKKDARFIIVTEDMAREEYEREWGTEDVRSLDDFSSTGDPVCKGWVTKDNIRVAEYWRVVTVDEKWVAFTDGSVRQVDEFPKDGFDATRVVKRAKVEGYKINAVRVLEKLPWLDYRIPLFAIPSEEINVDGKIVLKDMVTSAMDSQRMVNWTFSEGVAILSLASKSDMIIPADAVADYKDIWATRNVYNHAFLPYNQYDASGRALEKPHREQGEPANLQSAVELMRVAEEGIQVTTGIYASGLGAHDNRVLSGRAKQSEIQQSDLGTANYAAAVQIALIDVGNAIVRILPKITRPGQILHVLGLDDKPEKVIIGQHFTTQKGEPIPISKEEAAQMQPGMAQFYDLSKGRYAVTVKIGKANATKREEGAIALGELIPHLPPEMAAVATPDYVEQLDFEGSHQIAEKLRNALPPQLQEQPEDDQVPPALKAHIQQLTAQLEQAKQLIATDGAKEQAKQQTAMQKASLDAQVETARQAFELKIHAMDNAARIEIARISAKAQHADTVAGMAEEAIALDHEAVQNQHDRVHDVVMGQQAHAQALQQGQAGVAGDAALAEQGHEQALEQGAAGHAQALQQNEQAAELAPEPASGGE